MLLREILGNWLKENRLEKGLTQEKLATMAKIDRTQLIRQERKERSCSVEVFLDICDALELDPGEEIKKINKRRKAENNKEG